MEVRTEEERTPNHDGGKHTEPNETTPLTEPEYVALGCPSTALSCPNPSGTPVRAGREEMAGKSPCASEELPPLQLQWFLLPALEGKAVFPERLCQSVQCGGPALSRVTAKDPEQNQPQLAASPGPAVLGESLNPRGEILPGSWALDEESWQG